MSPQPRKPQIEKLSDFWKEGLGSRLTRLRHDAANNDGTLAPRSVRQLRDFYAIFKIQKSLDHPTSTPRWPIALAFFGTLFILSVLFFTHVRSTRIDLEATLSEISFTTGDDTRLPVPVPLNSVGIGGSTLEQQDAWACPSPVNGASGFLFHVVGAASAERNAISVKPLELPAGTSVILSHAGKSFHTQLTLRFPAANNDYPIVLTAVGNVELKGAGCDSNHTATPFDKLTFDPLKGQVLDLSFEPLIEDVATPVDIQVSKVSFFRVDPPSTPATKYALPLSTLLSGSLFFDSVGGRERKLREGERIEFRGFKGILHVLQIQKDRVRVRLSGEVSDVMSGESSSTLNPTLFEYLTVSQGLPSFLGAVLYCFGLAVAVMKWWRPNP